MNQEQKIYSQNENLNKSNFYNNNFNNQNEFAYNNSKYKIPKNRRKNSVIKYIAILGCITILIVIGFFLFKSKNAENAENKINDDIFYQIYHDTNNNNFYYYSSKENKIFEYKGYEKIEFKNEYAVFSKKVDNNLIYGIMDKNENMIIKPGKYSYIKHFNDASLFEVTEKSLYGIVDVKGNVILPTEYQDITYAGSFSDNTYVYIVKKEGKYYYLSSDGSMIKETVESSRYNISVKEIMKLDSSMIGAVEIDNKFYNSKTGEYLFDNSDDIDFSYNILFEKGKGLIIYDKNLNVKQKLSNTNIKYVERFILKSGYILLKERNDKGIKYYIFDKKLNIKKEVDCYQADDITIDEWENYFYVTEKFKKDNDIVKYKTTVYDKKLNEDSKEGQNVPIPLINESGEFVFIESDYENKIASIYSNGKIIFKVKDHKNSGMRMLGNYFVLKKTNTSYNVYDIYDYDGNLVIEDLTQIYYDDSGIYKILKKDKSESVFFKNGTVIDAKKSSLKICKNNLLLIDSKNKLLEIYDNSGLLKKTLTSVENILECDSDYAILNKTNDKYAIYSFSKNEITIEINKSSYNGSYQNVGLDIISLEDGFYSMNGKKILNK